jgi:hypothetical protein
MKKKSNKLYIFVLLTILIFGCVPTKTEALEKRLEPTPIPGTGGVKGKIIMTNSLDLNGLIVYLGDIIELTDEFSGGYLDTSKAPFCHVNPEDGTFYFYDIKPGTYSLIIYEVVSGGMVYYDNNGNVLKIEVKENKILDLGDIYFSFE